jgi:hypothetical protein
MTEEKRDVLLRVTKSQMEVIVDMVGNYGMIDSFGDGPSFADADEKEHVIAELLRAYLTIYEESESK